MFENLRVFESLRIFKSFQEFLDASTLLYMRVGPSVCPSVGNAFFLLQKLSKNEP